MKQAKTRQDGKTSAFMAAAGSGIKKTPACNLGRWRNEVDAPKLDGSGIVETDYDAVTELTTWFESKTPH